jgi:hypothetical protein
LMGPVRAMVCQAYAPLRDLHTGEVEVPHPAVKNKTSLPHPQMGSAQQHKETVGGQAGG